MNSPNYKENPKPISASNHSENSKDTEPDALEDLLDAQAQDEILFQRISNVQDMRDAVYADAVADCDRVNLTDIGKLMPRLLELKLSNSHVDSLRALGNTLGNLQVLWVTGCNLSNLDGVGSLPKLRELYAAYNYVSDLEPLQDCPHLQALDLEGNCIADNHTVEWLSLTKRLQSLTLLENPIALQTDYAKEVLEMVPWLSWLDDRLVQPHGLGPSCCTTNRAAGITADTGCSGEGLLLQEAALVRSGIKAGRVGVDSDEFTDARQEHMFQCSLQVCGTRLARNGFRPGSLTSWMRILQATGQPSTQLLGSSAADPWRPSSGAAPMRSPPPLTSGTPSRPNSNSSLPGSSIPSTPGGRAQTPAAPAGLYWTKNRLDDGGILDRSRHMQPDSQPEDSSSQLTHGLSSTLSGNVARGLRRWKSNAQEAEYSGAGDAPGARAPYQDPRDVCVAPLNLQPLDDAYLMDKLCKWKAVAASNVLRDVNTASPSAWQHATEPCSFDSECMPTRGGGSAGTPPIPDDLDLQLQKQGTAASTARAARSGLLTSSRHLLCKVLLDSDATWGDVAEHCAGTATSRGAGAPQPGCVPLSGCHSQRVSSTQALPLSMLSSLVCSSRPSSGDEQSMSSEGAPESAASTPVCGEHHRDALRSTTSRVVILSAAGVQEVGQANPAPIWRRCSDDE